MPVVTRSCGRLGTRPRIEDPTPRRPYTTIKRKKNQSDEETEKPAKKRAKNRLLTASVLVNKVDTQGKTQQNTSRIPRPCSSKKTTNKKTETNEQNCESNEKDENEIRKVQDENCQSNQTCENFETNVDDCNVTPPPQFADSSSPSSSDCQDNEEFEQLTPVAARTRSFSALKRSYRAKKTQKNLENASTAADTSCTTGQQSYSRTKTPEPVSEPNQEIVSSTCEGQDVESRQNEQESRGEKDCSNEKTNDFYKTKFHQMIRHLKTIQENFESAQAVASRNIRAYDAHIKELTDNLEREKTQATTCAKELKTTKEHLLDAQKELEQAKQQNSDVSIQTEVSKAEIEKVTELESKIKFYEMLSGLKLTQELPDSTQPFIESYSCMFKPSELKGKEMKFNLVYDKEIDEVEFSPVIESPTSGEFIQKLPRYLRENIYFSTDQATSFLLRLMQTTHKQR